MQAKEIKTAAVIGCGVIGASWGLLFAMNGLRVHLFDVVKEALPDAKEKMAANIDVLVENGALKPEEKEKILARVFLFDVLGEAVGEADFIQENGPERLPIKQELLAQIEAAAPEDAIYASSTSGLLISDIVAKAKHPERCIGGHPYNPPHLIPLVEMTYSEKTDPQVLRRAKEFYASLGKEPVVLNKECPGFIANRLQLAVYREMIDLVRRGVCSAEDADKALVYGPGIRWAIFGHNMIMQLGNPGGLKGMMAMLGSGGDAWLADMADWKHMPEDYGDIAQASVDHMMENFPDYMGHTNGECARFRDASLIEILKRVQRKF